MPPVSFGEMPCAVARTIDIIGDPWTPMILRDIALGVSRFDALQRDLDVSRKTLTQRLQGLVDHGIVRREPYQLNPPRYDYLLTPKGGDLALVLVAVQAFGDAWLMGDAGPPLPWHHVGCGAESTAVLCCDHCRAPLRPGEAYPVPGPGFDPAAYPELARAVETLAASSRLAALGEVAQSVRAEDS